MAASFFVIRTFLRTNYDETYYQQTSNIVSKVDKPRSIVSQPCFLKVYKPGNVLS